MRSFFVLLALASLPVALSAAPSPQTFQSGPARVALVELYTSEGCSSCPPADRWLGSLRNDPRLWHDFVPIAFHVNYWDRLGWKDRLSSRAYTQREYAYSSEWRAASVYTPCFVLNGAEWHADPGALNAAARSNAGLLSLQLAADPTPDRCSVHYTTAAPAQHLTAHVALLGGGISTKVMAGENVGSTLTHEFVVLALAESTLADSTATLTLPAPSVTGAPRSAVVAWITQGSSPRPLQSVGGWLVQ